MRCERMHGERGVALILTILVGGTLMMLSFLSVQMTLTQRVTRRVQRDVFMARQIADSAAAHALARIKEGGITAPFSGSGASAEWVDYSEGNYYYYSLHNAALNVTTIRAWGKIASEVAVSSSTAAPDAPDWDGTGWTVKGVEITVKGYKYIPDAPLYFGNGGIERPSGGFEWTGNSDLGDPSTWGVVTSSPSSFQTGSVPFESSALDHPPDFLYGGGLPTPAMTNPHPYKIWTSQNQIGQRNIESWFANSAGVGNDPTIGLTPPPTSSFYDTGDQTSPDYPYPVNSSVPDVQSFAWELWNAYHDNPDATLLNQGPHSGTYGDLDNPGITFVSGELQVDSSETFRGAGILVIRDDYDPNVDSNNRPRHRARLDINGTFEWTGLVIIAGWAPDIDVATDADATIVGALFGEDSVQSGGEISLDSATIILRVRDDFRVLFSNDIFQEGGIAHSFLPAVRREVVGITDL